MTKDEQTIANLKKLKSFHNGSYGADINRAIEAIEQESAFQKKAGIVISQLRADRDRIWNALDKIRAEIKGMTLTYHNLDWSITDLVPISEVLKIIDRYNTESEETDADSN